MNGIVLRKLGMTRTFLESGEMVPLTVLKLEKTYVFGKKTLEKDGYESVVLSVGEKKEKKINKPQLEELKKKGFEKRGFLKEVRGGFSENIGDNLSLSFFSEGSFVDVQGTTKGRGFQGVVKRWNFKGLPASHGNSVTTRCQGSTGCRQDPGKVMKGKKMAGHMGVVKRTIQNLKIIKIDMESGCLFLKGAVPGNNDSFVFVKKAVKKG